MKPGEGESGQVASRSYQADFTVGGALGVDAQLLKQSLSYAVRVLGDKAEPFCLREHIKNCLVELFVHQEYQATHSAHRDTRQSLEQAAVAVPRLTRPVVMARFQRVEEVA